MRILRVHTAGSNAVHRPIRIDHRIIGDVGIEVPALDDDRGISSLRPFLRRGNGLLKIVRLVCSGKDCQFF